VNTPNHASTDVINLLFEMAMEITKEHNRQLKADPTLAARLDTHPAARDAYVQQLTQFGMESYIDCNGAECFRPLGEGERVRAQNRAREHFRHRQHTEAVRREITSRRLAEIDPDWQDHYKTLEAAERAYWRELQSRREGLGHPFQPPEVK
jgi:hypothetical protein